jgi:hypothetical protein
MDTTRLLELLALKDEYDRMGLTDVEDYLAAGFTPEEIEASGIFGTNRDLPSGKTEAEARLADPDYVDYISGGATLEEYEPSARDADAYAMADKLAEMTGMSSREAYKYARDIMGTTDESAPLYNSMGLVDMTPLAAYYDTDLGLDTIGEGLARGDLKTVGAGALQTALGVGGIIPAEKLVAKGVGAVADPFFRKQAAEFTARNVPAFPVDSVAGYRTYLPSVDEMAMLNHLNTKTPYMLNPEEAAYLARRADAEAAAAAGMSDADIVDQFGILNMPVVDAKGNKLATRPYALLTDQEFAAMRPNAHAGWTTQYEDLGPRLWGDADPYTKTVRINSSMAPDIQARTERHEYGHADLDESNVNVWETGANPGRFENVFSDDNLTRYEMYHLSPGEMLARLASDEPTMATRLSFAETLNPYLNEKGRYSRVSDALATGLLSDTYKLPVTFRSPTKSGGGLQFPVTREPSRLPEDLVYDVYRDVPMDMSKARMYDWELNPRLPLSMQFGTVEELRDFLDMGRTVKSP